MKHNTHNQWCSHPNFIWRAGACITLRNTVFEGNLKTESTNVETYHYLTVKGSKNLLFLSYG